MPTHASVPGPGPHLEPTLVELPPTHTVVVRAANVPMATLAGVFDTALSAVAQVIGERQLGFAGAPFARYEAMPTETVTLELGFPVTTPLTESVQVGAVTVAPSRLPAGPAVTLAHVGPYAGLGASWGTLMSWTKQHGHTPDLPFWEVYVTKPTPEADPATLRTDLFLPVIPAP